MWKYNRIIDIEDKTLEKLYKVTRENDITIEDNQIKEIIEELVQCRGIGMPLASTILKFLRPDVFPIIDVRAYRALFGKKLYNSTYSYSKYIKYCHKIYEIRDITGMQLDKVDEQLYEFDKKYNSKI